MYSSNFTQNAYYIIDAKKDNYLHLTGAITNLKASVFFDKCISKIIFNKNNLNLSEIVQLLALEMRD